MIMCFVSNTEYTVAPTFVRSTKNRTQPTDVWNEAYLMTDSCNLNYNEYVIDIDCFEWLRASRSMQDILCGVVVDKEERSVISRSKNTSTLKGPRYKIKTCQY